MVQKVRSVLLFRSVSDWSHTADAMTTFLTFLEGAGAEEMNTDWSGKVKRIIDNFVKYAKYSS